MATGRVNIEELLRQRYGGNRFNPAGGQTQMSFQEWMDRHPSLQGMGKPDAMKRYEQSTGEQGGFDYLNRRSGTVDLANPAPPGTMATPLPELAMDTDNLKPGADVQLPGPDKPGNRAASLGPGVSNMPKATDVDYKTFAKSRGGSTAKLAGAWRGANDMKLTPKMASAVAQRRVGGVAGGIGQGPYRPVNLPARNKPARGSTPNNKQQQHPRKKK